MQGNEKLTLADREWTCPQCGIHHIRDWNAAKNNAIDIIADGTIL